MDEAGVSAFISLFRGRADCYGSWERFCVHQRLTRKQFEQHLTTGPFIGVYPLMKDMCSWGCIDIDFDDISLARNLQTMAAVKGIKLWIEKTVRGYHVWAFPSEPLVLAAHMRRALMAICKACGYNPKEVNPKSESLDVGKVGNFVRLPYPGGYDATERQFIAEVNSEIPIPLNADLEGLFVKIDVNGRTDVDKLEEVAALWTPPAKVQVEFDETAGLDARELLRKAGALSYTIWKNGVLEGNDRSTTLSHLAHELILTDGLEPSVAYKILESADRRWGKFHDRVDCEEQLMKLIEGAMSKEKT